MSNINAFISYAHADEKQLDRFHKHLAMLRREGSLSEWTDHAILPGAKVADEISSNLESSQIFIALLSPDYLASTYCYDKEFEQALTLAEAGKMRIVPVILEPCDWLSSRFKDFLALPKDGQPISSWTNQNNAFLDVVTGITKLLAETPLSSIFSPATAATNTSVTGRRLRVKQDFDSIQKSDFADKAYEVIKEFFRASSDELGNIGDAIRTKFEVMDPTAFTCSIVNRTKRDNGEFHITIMNSKQGGYYGDINFAYQRYARPNTSNGSIRVGFDDCNLFLTMDTMAVMTGKSVTSLSPEQAAEDLWNDFVKKAGIEYE